MRVKILYYFNTIWLLYTCPIFGQLTQYKKLSSTDYSEWSTLNNEDISPDGQWVCYSLSYESGLDTLVVQNVLSNSRLFIPKGSTGKFVGNDQFSCFAGTTFEMHNLKNGVKWRLANTNEYHILGSLKNIVLIVTNESEKQAIEIRDIKGKLLNRISEITSYSIDPTNKKIFYTAVSGNHIVAGIYSIYNHSNVIVDHNDDGFYDNISWQTNGSRVGFIHRVATHCNTVKVYELTSKKLYENTVHDNGWILDSHYADHFLLAPDGQHILFTMKKGDENKDTAEKVQVWNASSLNLYGYKEPLGAKPKWIIWNMKSDKTTTLWDENLPYSLMSKDGRYAILYNGFEYAPSAKQYADRDCYIIDLVTKNKKLLGKKLSGSPQSLKRSPVGARFAFSEDGCWYIYDPTSSKYIGENNLKVFTHGTENKDNLEFAAWATNAISILLYDKFDIWELPIDGSGLRRLTCGREHNIIYRLMDSNGTYNHEQAILNCFAFNYQKMGFALLSNGKVKDLVFTDAKTSQLRVSQNSKAFSFLMEKSNRPPTLLFQKNMAVDTLYQSNPQIAEYDWGKNVQINYNVDGLPLTGVLRFPFNYNPKNTYPMIVHLYERQAHMLHTFVRPTLLNGYGFNSTHLASQGYFVYFPDTEPIMGKPGISATQQVIASMDAVSQQFPIDRNRIAIFGQSFGGYEANFIITQTDMFRCAVSGSAISDYVSSYFAKDRGTGKTSYWRFESDQRRIGCSFFENRQRYLDNSPIYHAYNITTPLLHYTGEQDRQVDPFQSYEFHLALRRLNKKNILLVYPGEGHVFIIKENQADITNKIDEWFAHYLKKQPYPEWALPN